MAYVGILHASVLVVRYAPPADGCAAHAAPAIVAIIVVATLPLAFFAFVRHELIGRRVASYPAFKKQKTLMGERTEDRKRRSVRQSARISMRQPLKKGAECSSLVARLKLLLRAFLPAIPPRGPFTELATTGRREASYLGWVGNPRLVHRWGSLLGGARPAALPSEFWLVTSGSNENAPDAAASSASVSSREMRCWSSMARGRKHMAPCASWLRWRRNLLRLPKRNHERKHLTGMRSPRYGMRARML